MVGLICWITVLIIVEDNGILYQLLACGQSEINDYQSILTAFMNDMIAAAADRAVYGLLFRGAPGCAAAGNHR